MRGISCLAEDLLVSQGGLCSTEFKYGDNNGQHKIKKGNGCLKTATWKTERKMGE
jgi:hypothetical protein